jgi:hypothetical protein
MTAVATGHDNRAVGRRGGHWLTARVVLVLVLSFLPLLAISADVFGVVSQRTSAVTVILPLAGALVVVVNRRAASHRCDRRARAHRENSGVRVL